MESRSGDLTVINNEAEQQFEIRIGDKKAILAYERKGSMIAYLHTEVPTTLEGRGIAGQLAQHALEYARSEGLEVVPLCPYVSAYIERHQQYQELVAPRARWGEFPVGRA